MIDIEKQWLSQFPWEKVLSTHAGFCQAQGVGHQTAEKACLEVQALWDAATGRSLTLRETLKFCRQCCDRAPFVFNNGNTFAAIARQLIEDWAAAFPSSEAQILRGTVTHYVAGQVTAKELLQVLKYFARQAPAPVAAPAITRPTPSVQSGAA